MRGETSRALSTRGCSPRTLLAAALALLCVAPVAWAQPATSGPDAGTRELQRLQEEDRNRREAQERRPDVRLPATGAAGDTGRLPEGETPCVPIERIVIEGEEAPHFPWLLAQADRSADGNFDPAVPRCLGRGGIGVVMARLQNALVARGFITSRILVAPQDLRSGTLTLTLVPGKVHALRLAPGSNPRAALGPAFPMREGELLNLRDLEQGLENLRRLPSATAEIEIVPAEARAGEPEPGPGESDLVVRWRQSRPIRGSLVVDDTGLKAHGRLQGTATLALDHSFGLNDLLQFSLQHDLMQRPDRQGLRGQGLHYSLPWGDWSASLSANRQRFYQQVAGSVQNYVYSGENQSGDLTLRRLLRRDGSSKTFVSFSGWARASSQFLDDTEIEVQRRRTGGWTLGADHRQFIGPATLDLDLSYRRGTGAAGALEAPEAWFGEGVSRPRITSASAQLDWTFQLGGQRLRYGGSWRAQWSPNPLVPQDRFVIGGRHTVRGFDGESVLSAQRGWLLRNELGFPLGEVGQELFIGLDHGRVSGAGSELLAGHRLTGMVLGWRGGLPSLRVELFAGAPVTKPPGFLAPDRIAGFSVTCFF